MLWRRGIWPSPSCQSRMTARRHGHDKEGFLSVGQSKKVYAHDIYDALQKSTDKKTPHLAFLPTSAYSLPQQSRHLQVAFYMHHWLANLLDVGMQRLRRQSKKTSSNRTLDFRCRLYSFCHVGEEGPREGHRHGFATEPGIHRKNWLAAI